MRLFMRGSVEKSLRDFDEGLDSYFHAARKYRSSLRRGSIVLLDGDERMFNLLTFLSDKCGMKVGVVHVRKSEEARKVVEDIDPLNVKAVLIDSSMLEDSRELGAWLEEECPRVPVWVVNCEKEIKGKVSSRFGIIDKSTPMSRVVETIGFPHSCQQLVEEFASE